MADDANLLLPYLRALVDPARHETAADDELLSRWAANHDTQAFSGLVWRYGPLVWRVSRSVLAHKEDAEDAFQATFLVLARKAGALKRRPSVAGWLYQTAYHLAIKIRHASARRRRHEAQVGQKASTDPMEELSVREARTILTEELQRLPAGYRDPVVLCLYEGATQDEAARRLGCALSTLKRRLERGRTLLARRLTRRGLAPATALAVTLSSRAAVSGVLVQTTITAARDYVMGHALPGAAAAVAGGLLRTLLLKKLAVWVTVMLAVAGLSLGAGLVYSPTTQLPQQAKGPPAPPQAKVKDDPPPAPRLDRDGVALPPGALSRLGSQRFRQTGDVVGLVFAPDGKAIASAAADGSVRLWDAATGKLLWRLEAEKQRGRQRLAFSSDGKKLAMLNYGGYAVLDTVTSKILVRHKLPAPAKPGEEAISSAITADLTTLAVGFDDGSIRLVDAATGQEKMRFKVREKMLEFPEVEQIEFSPDGKRIYVSLTDERSVRVLDILTGKLVDTLKLDLKVSELNMAFSRDSQQFAVFGRVFEPDPKKVGNTRTGRVALWDLTSGKERHVIDLPLVVLAGTFSPDGKLFAVATVKGAQAAVFGTLVIFDTATGQERRRIPLLGPAHSLAFSPNGNTLATGESGGNSNLNMAGITLRSVATGELQSPMVEPRGAIIGTKFLPGNNRLITFGADGLYWWNVASGQSIRHIEDVLPMPTSMPAPVQVVRGDRLSPDEKIFVTRDAAGDLVLRDTTTNQPVRTLKSGKVALMTVLFSPDGAKLFSACGPGVTVWDVTSGKRLMELETQQKPYAITNLALSQDGRWLASWTQNGNSQTSDGHFDIHLWDAATGKLARRLSPRYGPAYDGAFSADSNRLVIVCGESGQRSDRPLVKKTAKANKIQLWDVATGKEVGKFQTIQEHFESVAISPDGRMVATGKWKPRVEDPTDAAVKLWDVATGTERGRIQGHESRVNFGCMDFSPDGRLLAATSADAPIYIWDVYALEKSQFAKVLTKEDKDKLWQQLADEDAIKAFQAVRELIARPVDAVTIFQDGWKRVPRATAQQMQKWTEDLGSDQFAVRQKAQVELDRYLAGHETLLANAIEKANTLEQRQRLEALLNRLQPERLRRTRMLEVLERIGVGPARQLLQNLAEQTHDVEMSREAKAGLKRLDR